MPKIVAAPFTYIGEPKGEELYTSKKTFHFEKPP
jgi:hypothetical protein